MLGAFLVSVYLGLGGAPPAALGPVSELGPSCSLAALGPTLLHAAAAAHHHHQMMDPLVFSPLSFPVKPPRSCTHRSFPLSSTCNRTL